MTLLSTQRERWRLWKYNRHSHIKYYNFWRDEKPEEMWFTRFIKYHFPNSKQQFNFTSILGSVKQMDDNHKGVNIFYTGENIHSSRFFAHLKQYTMQRYDLSIGFDYNNSENYMRLPLWVMWHFPPDATQKQLNAICEEMNHPATGNRDRFCALVCSHDQSGLRKEIMECVNQINPVDSAGQYCRNTDLLQSEFANDKTLFLQQYRYNICPENSDYDGYVTEKIFDALKSGCIPIYNGSNNNPEPDVINHNAVLFWECGKDNADLITRIHALENSNEAYQHFIHQPRLTLQAADIIWQYYSTLYDKLKQLA